MKMHFATANNVARCNTISSNLTADRTKVTCKNCLVMRLAVSRRPKKSAATVAPQVNRGTARTVHGRTFHTLSDPAAFDNVAVGLDEPRTVLVLDGTTDIIQLGAAVKTFRGEWANVTSIEPPRGNHKSGYVSTELGRYYAEVYGLEFITQSRWERRG